MAENNLMKDVAKWAEILRTLPLLDKNSGMK